MYFPYLRGKQFELIALRELGPVFVRNQAKISIILEPVKESPTLRSAISSLNKNNVNFTLILNPSVGELSRKKRKDPVFEVFRSMLLDCRNFQLGVLIDPESYGWLEEILGRWSIFADLKPNGLTFIHNEVNSRISEIQQLFSERLPILYNVVNLKRTTRRYYHDFNRETVVTLDDYFLCLDRNVDYVEHTESQFSDEHLYYKGDEFFGFGDFLTIGDNYHEGGFLPRAVVIHLSYADPERKIRLMHFVSDDNENTADVAGKFAQANRKLVAWCDAKGISTLAIDEFRRLDQSQHFPGLGTIKKLSIMNHIELVLSLI